MWNTIFNWFYDLLKGFANAISWLTTPLDTLSSVFGSSITPLHICGFGSLVIVISYALVKWVIPT